MGLVMCLTAVSDGQLFELKNSVKLKSFLAQTQNPFSRIPKVRLDQLIKDPVISKVAALFRAKAGITESEFGSEGLVADLDKVWHGLHWILTGTAYAGQEPVCYLLHKGTVLGDFGEGQIRGITSNELAAFYDAIKDLNITDVRKRFDGKAMVKANLYLSVMWERSSDEGIEAISMSLEKLKNFLRQAKDLNQGMIIWTT